MCDNCYIMSLWCGEILGIIFLDPVYDLVLVAKVFEPLQWKYAQSPRPLVIASIVKNTNPPTHDRLASWLLP